MRSEQAQKVAVFELFQEPAKNGAIHGALNRMVSRPPELGEIPDQCIQGLGADKVGHDNEVEGVVLGLGGG
jgi:hypothetical protein